MEIFLVGGAVRDRVMGRPCKDWDFTVVLAEGDARPFDPFTAMEDVLVNAMDFEVLARTPDKFTLRCRAPKGWTFMGELAPRVCDFVLARKERQVGAGRGNIAVEVGTLHDDLARRDFTMNAMAMDKDGTLIDPFGGLDAIANGRIESVGHPSLRFEDDGLRVLRALRFAVTLGFELSERVLGHIVHRGMEFATDESISIERTREELLKMFRVDTARSLELLAATQMLPIVSRGGVWLKPTSEAQ